MLDNVIVGALHKERSVAAARSHALSILRKLDLDSKAHLPASSLTLPDRKRLEVARALATRPRLLLLDEVMAGLRPTECDQIVAVFRELNRAEGLTILLIEHVMRAVMALAGQIGGAAPRRGHRARHAAGSGARPGGAGVLPRRGDRSLMLSVRNLDLYYGDAQALSDVSLEVGKGEIVAIVGANGAGKSSLIRCIAGMEVSLRAPFASRNATSRASNPTRSATSASARSPKAARCSPPSRCSRTCRWARCCRARAPARRRRLQDVFAMFPRLGERKDQLAGTMSGGEQQMLAIGRCLMGAPELIMFDEPSLGLAPLVVQEVLHTIRLLNERGLTILLVEQNVAVSLKISSRAYVLENGRIVMSGAGSELLHDDRVRQAYLGL